MNQQQVSKQRVFNSFFLNSTFSNLSFSFLSFLLIALFFACNKNDAPIRNPDDFYILSVSPSHALRGATIVIKGNNFSTRELDNEVLFAGSTTAATVLDASATELSVLVPADAVTGKITVKKGNKSAQTPQVFTIDDDVAMINDFNPKQGPFGTVVTITGKKFGNDVAVSINNVEAQLIQKSATEIVFSIPANTTLTAHKIKVVSDGTTLETASNFTVTAPGAFGQWISKNVNAAPAAIFQSGVSFVYKNKIYWGFSKMSFNQPQADYMILDPNAPALQWTLAVAPPADMVPAQLQDAIAVVHNDVVYFGTGLAPAASKSWWKFNPETNVSTRLADYPEATANALSFVLNGNIYAGFGGNNNKLHRYDIATNSWALAATAVAQDVSSASAFVIGGEAFIGRALLAPGGERKTFFKYTGGNNLPQVNGLPESIQSPKTPSFTIGVKGYFVTGSKVWEYTPSATGGDWRVVSSAQNAPAITQVAMVTVNNQPAVFGWTGNGQLYEFKMN
jgi:hypothetical protein